MLHLFNCLLYRDDTCDAEECRLEDSVGTVAETNLLSNLSCIDVVNLDFLLSENCLHLVRDVVDKFLTVPDSIEKECTALLDTTSHIVHVEVSLLVTCNEVRSSHEIS